MIDEQVLSIKGPEAIEFAGYEVISIRDCQNRGTKWQFWDLDVRLKNGETCKYLRHEEDMCYDYLRILIRDRKILDLIEQVIQFHVDEERRNHEEY